MLLRRPGFAGDLFSAADKIIAQRWPSLPDDTTADVVVEFEGRRTWVCVRRTRIMDDPQGARYVVTARTLDPDDLPAVGVVEDERIVAKSLEERLSKLGYQVCAAVDSGEEAVELAGRLQPDLVLMDIYLRGAMTGIEAARQIWDRFQVPIVYVTAYADLDTLKNVKTTENYGYVVKPFESPAVRAAVELALARRERELR